MDLNILKNKCLGVCNINVLAYAARVNMVKKDQSCAPLYRLKDLPFYFPFQQILLYLQRLHTQFKHKLPPKHHNIYECIR